MLQLSEFRKRYFNLNLNLVSKLFSKLTSNLFSKLGFKLKSNLTSFFRSLTKPFALIGVLSLLLSSFSLGFVSFYGDIDTEAKFTQDNNTGTFDIDFESNETGLEDNTPTFRQNVDIDTSSGVAALVSGQTDGFFTTSTITPVSFSAWDEIVIDGIYNDPSDILVSLYTCDPSPSPITGFENMTLTGGKVSISSLDKNTYPCVRARVDLSSTGIDPVINNLRVTWDPLPVFLVKHGVNPTVSAGQNLVYTINYSVSYSDSENTVVWSEIPSTGNGGITDFNSGYAQNPSLDFVSANKGGQYTATSIVVNGVTIPAGSVYWDLGTVERGSSNSLTYTLSTDNGWENGMTFTSFANMDSSNADLVISDSDKDTAGDQGIVSVLSSRPYPQVNKTVSGTIKLDGQEHVWNSNGYSPNVTYRIETCNASDSGCRNGINTGQEEIFNPVLNDDLSDISDNLINYCGATSSNWTDRITVNNGGFLVSPPAIIWLLDEISPGEREFVSFEVDYTGCPYDIDLSIDNTATLSGNNITSVTDDQLVVFRDDFSPTVIFSKGDEVRGSRSITRNVDDNGSRLQPYGETFSYLLNASNPGVIRLDDVVLLDKIPDGVSFVSATLPSQADGVIYYSTSGGSNPPETPPAFDWTTAPGSLGSNWSTIPPLNPGDVEWVAFYIPCLDGSQIGSPLGSQCYDKPTSVNAEIEVKIDVPTDACSAFDTTNTGLFNVFSASDSLGNDDGDITPLAQALSGEDKEPTHIVSEIADLNTESRVTGPSTLEVYEEGEWTIRIKNSGFDTALNTTTVIDIPEVNVNGVPTRMNFSGIEGGSVDLSNLPNSITVDLGDIPAGSERIIKLKLTPQIGANGSFTVNANTTAEDDLGCREIRDVSTTTSYVVSDASLELYKSRDESIIGTTESIHYQLEYFNTGLAPSRQTFVIDGVPEKTVFSEAYTSGTDSNGNSYTCVGCKVYFAKKDGLPANLNASEPFDKDIIYSDFTLGSEVGGPGSGIWSSPFGVETKYIAFLVDDPNTNLFGAGYTGTVGFEVINDDDGMGSGTAGSPTGTILYNYSAIFSERLLQAIGNTVFTNVSDDPGLDIEKQSSDESVYSDQEFDWIVDYYNDSTNSNITTEIIDNLPYEVELLNVYHTWNNEAIGNDGSLPTGEVDITADANTTITSNPNGTTDVSIDITSLRGSDLAFLEGGSLRFRVKAKSDTVTGQSLFNEVVGNYSNLGGGGSVSATDTVTVENSDLWLRKIASRQDPFSGEEMNYTLLLSNEGKNEASNLVIVDNLPPGLCYVGPTVIATTGWNIGEPGIVGDCATTGQTLFWGDLDGDASSNPEGIDYPLGVIPGKGGNGGNGGGNGGGVGDILINYKVQVDSSVAPGTDLTNDAVAVTSSSEDPNYENEDSVTVTTPLPDLNIQKDALVSVDPGDLFRFYLNYQNQSRQPADDVYFVDSLPDYDGDGNVDIKINNVSTSTKNEDVYYHTGSLSSPAPAFDPSNPTSNGWTNTLPTSPTPPTFIAFNVGTLGSWEGYGVNISAEAVDPNTLDKIADGIELINNVEIFTSSTPEEDTTNNQDQTITRTPGLDLYINKTGSSEGAIPGIKPGDSLTYTIEGGNTGSVKACAVWVEDVIPPELEVLNPLHNFIVLDLKDSNGNLINPIDINDNEITDTVVITPSDLGGGNYRWELGNVTNPYTNVCLPPDSHFEFQIFTKVRNDILDSTNITNTVQIGEDSISNDNIPENDTDDSEVTVFRADLLTEKNGFSCGEDSVCDNADDSETEAYLSELIKYNINYNNIGNTDAENVRIEETIPEGTCYQVGSVEANQPPASQVFYSNNNKGSWDYIPTADANGNDCNVTDFKVEFTFPLPAPATFDGEDTYEQLDGSRNQTVKGRYLDKPAEFPEWEWVLADEKIDNSMGYEASIVHDVATDNQNNVYTIVTFARKFELNNLSLSVGDELNSLIIKQDSDGNILWHQLVASSQGRAIEIDPNGDIYISGYFYDEATFGSTTLNTSSGAGELYLAKLDSGGNWDTAMKAGYSLSFWSRSMIADNFGNIYLTGRFRGTVTIGSTTLTNNSGAYYIAKLNTSGIWEWVREFRGQIDRGMTTDSNGDIYFNCWGSVSNFGSADVTEYSGGECIAKMNSNGNWIWAKDTQVSGWAVDTDQDDNLYILGEEYDSVTRTTSSYLTTYNTSTNEWGWKTQLPERGDQTFYRVIVQNNSVYVSSEVDEVFIAEYNLEDGELKWLLQTENNYIEDVATSISVDSQENIYAVGMFSSHIKFNDKYEFDIYTGGSGTGTSFIAKISSTPPTYLQPDDVIGLEGFFDDNIVNYESGFSWDSGQNLSEIGEEIIYSDQNNTYIAQSKDTAPGGSIIKLDSNNQVLWETNTHLAYATKFDGTDIYSLGYNTVSNDYSLQKLDSNGNIVWSTLLPDGTGTAGFDLDSSGNIYVSASVTTPTPDNFVAKLDSSGTLLGVYQVSGDVVLKGVQLDSDENIYAVGEYTDPFTFASNSVTDPDYTNIALLKWDSSGNEILTNSFVGDSNNPEISDFYIDDSNNKLYLSGKFGPSLELGYKTLTTSTVDGFFARVNTNLQTELTEQTNTGYSAKKIEVDDLENIYIASDYNTFKYNKNGNQLWNIPLGSKHIFPISTDKALITGGFSGNLSIDNISLNAVSGSDGYLIEVRGVQNLIQTGESEWEWVTEAGGASFDYGNSLDMDSSGNIYLTGNFQGTANFGSTTLTSSGGNDIFIAKYDNNGNVLWAEQAGGTGQESSRSINIDSNGDVYVTGYFQGTATFDSISLIANGTGGYSDTFLAKYNSNGNLIWVQQAGGDEDIRGNAVVTDAIGNVYVTGGFENEVTFDSINLLSSANFDDVFIVKYDTNGNPVWARTPGAGYSTSGIGIAIDASGNVYVTGYFYGPITFDSITLNGFGNNDIFVVKYDPNGNVLWAKESGSTNNDFGQSINIDPSGNVYVTGTFSDTADFDGTTLTSSGGSEIFIAKYDTNGNLSWVEQVEVGSPGTELEFAL